MPDRPPHSRFGRLPGLFRTGEHRAPDPHEEPLPLTVYLPGRLLDVAESLAARQGATSVQDYCEGLLRMAIEREDSEAKAQAVHVTQGTLDSLDELASDPLYLVEWNAKARDAAPDAAVNLATEVDDDGIAFSRSIVLRHAGMGEDEPASFLGTLRRGEGVEPDVAEELIGALRDLEERLSGAQRLERRLAYALHRLAFVGQVLLTDAPAENADPATVDRVRLVQEAVDRVLSGEDIRYFSDAPVSGEPLAPGSF